MRVILMPVPMDNNQSTSGWQNGGCGDALLRSCSWFDVEFMPLKGVPGIIAKLRQMIEELP